MPIEIEIKFRVDDPATLTRRLEESGFSLLTPRSFESNVLFDTPDRQLRARIEIVRIRNYAGHWTLTHKRPPDVGPGGASLDGSNSGVFNPDQERHKRRIETETEVADGEALAEVFVSLGLSPVFRYEKWRTEWQDGEGHCVVDETPIGNFSELEGPPEWIDRVAARLGISEGDYITLSYGRLFDLWRAEHNSAAEDLTFAAVAQYAPQHSGRASQD